MATLSHAGPNVVMSPRLAGNGGARDNLRMPKSKTQPVDATPEEQVHSDPDADTLEAELDSLRTELAAAQTKVEVLESELRDTKANRDAITVERAAMWRDYCRLRDVLARAFPEIPDPDAKSAVGSALAAGQSH
jgi:hypothetical protein